MEESKNITLKVNSKLHDTYKPRRTGWDMQNVTDKR